MRQISDENVKDLLEIRAYLAGHKKGKMSYHPEVLAGKMLEKMDNVLADLGEKL